MTKEFGKKATPLMVLLQDRRTWDAPEYKKPGFTAEQLAEIDRTVARYAKAHASDPYAAARVRNHLLRGYVLAHCVNQDLDRLLHDG